MRWATWILMAAAACVLPWQTLAQTAPSQSPGKSQSSKTSSPLTSQFKAYKVHFSNDGKEELQPASNASPGDVIEYVAQHRNVSQKRLLNVDFAIPIPWGTTLWNGSVQPDTGKLVDRPSASGQKTNGSQVSWRVERMEPGEKVEFKLRVSIDPDPSLKPAPAPNPWVSKRPELRKN
jgi:uncharacterized repeat protein (TIGR01451 family)